MNIIHEDSVWGVSLYDAGEGEEFVIPGFADGLRRGRYYVMYPLPRHHQHRLYGCCTDDLDTAQHRYEVELARSKGR
ncbi:TPA: hypothetical protein ACM37O_004225 [Escherichia coli]